MNSGRAFVVVVAFGLSVILFPNQSYEKSENDGVINCAISSYCFRLEKTLLEQPIVLEELDQITKEIVFTDKLSRERKLDILMSQLLLNEENQFVFEYLSDVLTELEPVEKTGILIQHYYSLDAHYLRQHYLDLLLSSNHRYDEPRFIDEKIRTKRFLDSLLLDSHDLEITARLCAYYPVNMADADTYANIDQQLNQLKTSQYPLFKKVVTDALFWYRNLGLVTKEGKTDLIVLEKILGRSKSYSEVNPRDPELNSLITRSLNTAIRWRLQNDSHLKIPTNLKSLLNYEIDQDHEDVLREAKRIQLEMKKALER